MLLVSTLRLRTGALVFSVKCFVLKWATSKFTKKPKNQNQTTKKQVKPKTPKTPKPPPNHKTPNQKRQLPPQILSDANYRKLGSPAEASINKGFSSSQRLKLWKYDSEDGAYNWETRQVRAGGERDSVSDFRLCQRPSSPNIWSTALLVGVTTTPRDATDLGRSSWKLPCGKGPGGAGPQPSE